MKRSKMLVDSEFRRLAREIKALDPGKSEETCSDCMHLAGSSCKKEDCVGPCKSCYAVHIRTNFMRKYV